MGTLESCKHKGHGFDSRWCHWNFSLKYSFRLHYGPGVESASAINEYQQYFLGCKRDRRVGLTTLPFSFADCLEIWEHQLLEPSGPVLGLLYLYLTNLNMRVSVILYKCFVRFFASRIHNHFTGILNIVPNFYLASASVLFSYELYSVTDLEKFTSSI